MHAEVQDLCPVIWNVFLRNSNFKSRAYENTSKIFPNRHQIPIPDWWTRCRRWVCLHQNNKSNVWTKTVIHHIIQSAYFAHVATRLLFSALQNWTLGTQDQKNKTFPLCGWFWSEIFYQRLYKSLSRSPKKELFNLNRLGGKQLPRIGNRLET